jgi:isoquinoline 1-oxidoreductase beta subunit
MKRRTWLLSGLGATGALVVGWAAVPPRVPIGAADAPPFGDGPVALNGWLRIAPDGQVQLAMPRSEMGQGVHTALSMLVAEELDVRLSQVSLFDAPDERLYGSVTSLIDKLPSHPSDREPGSERWTYRAGQWFGRKMVQELGITLTGGSSSVMDAWEPLRLAAATARAQLLGAAALTWKLPRGELRIDEGVVSHASGPKAHFGELVKQAAATPAGVVTPKSREDWRLIGTPAGRTDLVAKTHGQARFGLDVRQPGQLYAVVRHCPMLGGSIARADVSAALALPGVERVVRLGSYAGSAPAVAVVGRSTWHAIRGAQALQIDWQPAPQGPVDTDRILDDLAQRARAGAAQHEGLPFHRVGDADGVLAQAERRVEALYRAPYLAHAAMEPINCTAQVKDGRVTLWAPTQSPSAARALAAQVAEVPREHVELHVPYLGGGFGRRLDVDYVGQAVRVALETGGRPVQLVWPREEDLRHDFYRPAGAAFLQAALDAQGRVQALHVTSAGDALIPRWIERTMPALMPPFDIDPPDKTASEGLFDLPYGVPNQRMAHVATHHDMPVGWWRAVGYSHNAFFSESFIDELAHAVGRDPLAFRLGLLEQMPQHSAVLLLAADKAGWGRPLPAGRARGVALHGCFDSLVAMVAEVSLVEGRPRVHRVVCAADVGTVINPQIVAQQMESAVVFGLSAALYGRVDVREGVVQQSNFPNHPILRMDECPRIETHLVESTRPPGGVGEPGLPPVAPAVANALFALTGERLRELPLVR